MDQEIRPIGTLESAATCWGIAALVGFGAFAMLMLLGDWSFLQAAFAATVVLAALGTLLTVTLGRPMAPPTDVSGRMQMPTETRARVQVPGGAGEAAMPEAADPSDTHARSPHREAIPRSIISTTAGTSAGNPNVNKSISPGPGGTPAAEAAPATRIPGPAPVNAADAAVARPVGATTGVTPMMQPTPFHGRVVSPEPPEPLGEDPGRIARNDTAPTGGVRPAPTATAEAQSYNEVEPLQPAKAGGAAGGMAADGMQAMPVAGASPTGGAETTAGSTGGQNVADGTPVARSSAPSGADGPDGPDGANGREVTIHPTPEGEPTPDPVGAEVGAKAAAPGSAGGGADADAEAGGDGQVARDAAAAPDASDAERPASPTAEDGAAAEAAGRKPETLAAPRGDGPDDLKQIRGVGPKLEEMLHGLGFYHFAQIAAWTDEEVAWVDANLEGFRGRVSRDEWVSQARVLADGDATAFSKRVDEGGVS